MPKREAVTARPRVLLISDDDPYSAALKPHLPKMAVMSLWEDSVWVAIRAGLDVTRGVDVVLIDRGVSGRLQLRLYETLRPADRPSRVPVIFVRSRLTSAAGGFDDALDTYQPEDATLDQAGRLVTHVLAMTTNPITPPITDSIRPGGVGARRTASVAAGQQRSEVALGPGILARIGLWAVAIALIGFTFWPLLDSGPVRDAVVGQVTPLAGDQGKLGDSQAKLRAALRIGNHSGQ